MWSRKVLFFGLARMLNDNVNHNKDDLNNKSNNSAPSGYKKLLDNTIIFALGSFSSKILMILLVNVYTTYLTQAEMGTNDIIQQIANWLLPIVTLTVSESVIRFGLDKAYDKRQVFTIANTACFTGLAALAVILPIVTLSGAADKYIHGYSLLIFVYMITASVKLVYSNFLRALEKIKLYAVNSILTTAFTLVGTVLFICVFKMGNAGYLYSIIISDLLSIIFMTVTAKLWKYFDIKHFDTALAKTMLAYCIPLIPAQIMWLITNSSDSFMTTHYLGSERNGILSASYKIANLVSTVYLMFGQAWNMSAIQENNSVGREDFYTKVFSLNQSFMYVMAAGILLINRPLTYIWVNPAYHEAMLYSPILTLATVFTCFNVFLGSVYIAEKRTKRSFATSLAAGIINIILNFALIPRFGIYGAAGATFAAYFAVFFFRLFDTPRLIHFKFSLPKILINTLLMTAMAVINQFSGWWVYAALAALFAAVLALNFSQLLKIAAFILPKKLREKLPFLNKTEIFAEKE